MAVAFISDLHLDDSNPYIADLFKQFLTNCISQISALYILGDFFESWIGDDDLTPFNQDIMNALHQATQNGLSIYIMHGNRDFLIGKQFLRLTGCKLLPDEYVITIAGTPILLMHGDTLCTQDIKYQKFRKKSRSWLFKTITQFYSLKKRRALAQKYREASKIHTSKTAEYIMDVSQVDVERVMIKHQVLHLIHGHTHRPATHEFMLNNQHAQRMVLAPWHEHGGAIFLDDDLKFSSIIVA